MKSNETPYEIDFSHLDFQNIDLSTYFETGNPNDIRTKKIRDKYFSKTLELISEEEFAEVRELGVEESSRKLLIAPFVNKCSIIGSSYKTNGVTNYILSHIPPSMSQSYFMKLINEKKFDRENFFSIGYVSDEGRRYIEDNNIPLIEINCENKGSKDIILSPLENMLWIVSEEEIFKWSFLEKISHKWE
ncbi:MAG: hypothetical protein ACMXYB_00865 [Candidatus Woesearchaeota archaeon]